MDIIDESGVLGSTDGTATEKVEQLIEKAEWENLWYEMTKRVHEFTAGFMGSTVIKKLPRADFSNVIKFNDFFKDSSIEEIDYYIDCKNCTNMSRMFLNTPNLKRIVGLNVSNVTGAQQTFDNCAVEVIERPLDFSKIGGNSAKPNWGSAPNLREIRFAEKCLKYKTTFNSEHLSDDSIQSIIGGLADLTGGTAQDLVLHKDVKAKLTETQLATITSKNWNLA
jgi:hypothetical protein